MNNLTVFGRDEYSGRTDIYALAKTTPVDFPKLLGSLSVKDMSAVLAPIQTRAYVLEATGRLSRYQQHWEFYEGRQFFNTHYKGDVQVPTNYCNLVADKRVSWTVGKGTSFVPSKGNELVANVLESIWNANHLPTLLRSTAQFGHVSGDAFWYISLQTKTRGGKVLPADKWKVKISALDPAFCFPVWSEDDPDVLSGVIIQFLIAGPNGETIPFACVMTATTIQFFKDGVGEAIKPNPLGLVPVVHMPFGRSASGRFGSSVVSKIQPLNVRHNELTAAIDSIIKYHGEPTTLIYGCRMSTLEKGSGRVWSGLPSDGKVENLEMKGDLNMFTTRLTSLEQAIYQQGRTPKVCFDSAGLAISNTSGVSMSLLFQPLVEAAAEDQETLAKGMRQANEIISEIHSTLLNEDLSLLADDKDSMLDMSIRFASLLPRDLKSELEAAAKKVELGIWSRAEASRRLSENTDTERHALEVAADQMNEIVVAAEKARALQGLTPNLSAAFVGSLFINEDLVDLAGKVGKVSSSGAGAENQPLAPAN